MQNVKHNSWQAWFLAIRPKTLTGALIPVMIGTALASMDGHFQLFPAMICFLFAGLMQIAANLINDLYDFLKGTDREDRLGPDRACAKGWISPSEMKKGILITIILACMIGSTLLALVGWKLIIVGLICVLFAFLYTTGPYPLSYNGWGDLLVLIFFGFIPVGGTYYVQAFELNESVVMASIISGLLINTLLVVNNYRDREADAKSGKRTLVVRFGETFGSYFYLTLGIIASLICLFFSTKGHHLAAFLPQLYLIPHFMTWRKMVQIHSGKKLNSILGETSRNILLMGILLSLGMLFS